MHAHADAPAWLFVIYFLSVFSNLGPIICYSIIMWGTHGGTSLSSPATTGAKVFFASCATAHGFMLVMMLAMPVAWFASALGLFLLIGSLLANIAQTIGGVAVVTDVAHRNLRRILFAPAGEPPPEDVRAQQEARGRAQSRRGEQQDARGEQQDKRGEAQDRREEPHRD